MTIILYSKYFNNYNFKLVYHNDYKVNNSNIYIPIILNNTINIGFLNDYNVYKGKEKINLLANKYKVYKNYKINFYIKDVNIPAYNPSEFTDYIKKYNLHCLTLLNKWAETYCYALTLFINSGLPILYNNFGALKERIDNKPHYFKVYDNESEYNNNIKLFSVFENLLNYIINNQNINEITNDTSCEIIYNNFYDYLFNKEIDYSIIFNKIKPFCIYFPQFHKIQENDYNYYENMTDITNLNFYLTQTNNEELLDSPKISNYNLCNLTDYNLKNYYIIKKQIDIAKENGIYGFGVYYYWFSINEISNKNIIMQECYNNFFYKVLDNFKIFLIWANENWFNNPAFNSEKNIINTYEEEDLINNSKNLVLYFKHPNYYKINNRPVFYIHHPWFIEENKIDLFFTILNKECKKNDLDNVYLVVNASERIYDNYYNYVLHPNYKGNTNTTTKLNNRNVILYDNYIDYISKMSTEINQNSIFFNFNNTCRLYIPSKLELRTHTINNNIFNQSKFIDIILNKYLNKVNDIDKILLINSWNEWGENMAIEPSLNNDNFFLNLLKFKLIKFI